ncbi:COMM domain-containing protein 7 [Rhinophrynus dorsalis]
MSGVYSPVPGSAASDIQSIRQLSGEVAQLCQMIFVFLKEQTEVEHFTSQLDDFAQGNGICLGPLKILMKSILLVLNGAMKRSLSADQLRADLISLGLDEGKAEYFVHEWSRDISLLTQLAVGRTPSINRLVDMEWKFGVSAASSELEKAGSIFLQLKMVIKRGSVSEPVYMELTLPQFYSFLHEMERAKSALDFFSGPV